MGTQDYRREIQNPWFLSQASIERGERVYLLCIISSQRITGFLISSSVPDILLLLPFILVPCPSSLAFRTVCRLSGCYAVSMCWFQVHFFLSPSLGVFLTFGVYWKHFSSWPTSLYYMRVFTSNVQTLGIFFDTYLRLSKCAFTNYEKRLSFLLTALFTFLDICSPIHQKKMSRPWLLSLQF